MKGWSILPVKTCQTKEARGFSHEQFTKRSADLQTKGRS